MEKLNQEQIAVLAKNITDAIAKTYGEFESEDQIEEKVNDDKKRNKKVTKSEEVPRLKTFTEIIMNG